MTLTTNYNFIICAKINITPVFIYNLRLLLGYKKQEHLFLIRLHYQ
ncbi:hypothetical protein H4V97_001064 [Flavobacterium sp. CG_23.5]|nr:hypothetical protein [Flavobacterium sp. CG_9.10]MBP2282746.1 hypothetical protein [Flavobacterium sp. CG_23.5]